MKQEKNQQNTKKKRKLFHSKTIPKVCKSQNLKRQINTNEKLFIFTPKTRFKGSILKYLERLSKRSLNKTRVRCELHMCISLNP